MIKTKIGIAIATLTLALSCCWARSNDPLSNLTKGQIQSIQSFPVEGTQLTGYLYENRNNYNIAYFNKKDQYWMIEGQLINAKDDTNITQTLAKKYIAPLLKKKREELTSNTQELMKSNQFQYFTKGSDDSAPKMWVMGDPNCGYCKKLDHALEPLFKNNRIQVRFIPVALFKGSDKLAAEQLVLNNKIPQDEALDLVKKNTRIFSKNHFGGTPQIFYMNNKNQPTLIPGYIDKQKIETLLEEHNIGRNWS
jgi:protein-disulfide isomerase